MPVTMNTCTWMTAVAPGATLESHVSSREERISVGDEVIGRCLRGNYRAYSLGRYLAQYFCDVGNLDLNCSRVSATSRGFLMVNITSMRNSATGPGRIGSYASSVAKSAADCANRHSVLRTKEVG